MAGVNYFPLRTAFLCENCQSVSDNPRRCPACAAESLMALATVLNRTEERKTQDAEEEPNS